MHCTITSPSSRAAMASLSGDDLDRFRAALKVAHAGELAKAVGVGRHTIWRMAKGKSVRDDTVWAVLDELGLRGADALSQTEAFSIDEVVIRRARSAITKELRMLQEELSATGLAAHSVSGAIRLRVTTQERPRRRRVYERTFALRRPL